MTILTDLDAAITSRPGGLLRLGVSAERALAAVHPDRPADATPEWRPRSYRGIAIVYVDKPASGHAPDGDRFWGWELAA